MQDRPHKLLPVNLTLAGQTRSVKWLGPISSFGEPFFRQIIERTIHSEPSARLETTDVDDLIAYGQQLPNVTPAGVIVHISRCGSTLLANALRIARDCMVLSEPQPITTLFLNQTQSLISAEMRNTLASALVQVFGNFRKGVPESVVLKLAAPNLFDLSGIRRLWPEVPCVILIRNPLEVIVSQLNVAGGWVSSRREYVLNAPGRSEEREILMSIEPEEFCARIVGKLCESAIRNLDRNCFVLDYSQLNMHTAMRISALFSLRIDSDNDDKMERIFHVYSKDPEFKQPFIGDHGRKQKALTDKIREASQRWARPPYEKLVTRAFANDI